MPTWLGLVILVIVVASRPIEVRLWRAGRISDRTVTILVLVRLPVVVAVAALATGGLTLPTVALIGAALLPPLFFYRYTVSIVQEASAEQASSRRVEARHDA